MNNGRKVLHQKVENKAKDIRRQLAYIEKRLQDYEAEMARERIHYGHLGDLAYATERLMEVGQFLGNTEDVVPA